nr:unnamed protein product [Callosobruchus analis]
MKADSSMKDDFHLLTLEQFWIKRLPVNSTLAYLALKVLIRFSSIIKTKQQNPLDIDSDLMKKTEPRIDQLVLNMQYQVSHSYLLLLYIIFLG